MPRQLSQRINVGELKYYFSVDTKYVTQKLKLLLFPFATKVALALVIACTCVMPGRSLWCMRGLRASGRRPRRTCLPSTCTSPVRTAH